MISHDDIVSLKADKSPANRARITRKVALLFRDHHLVDRELYLSEQILDMAARDAAVLIRQVLAETLKECGHVPHRLAVKLAHDAADTMVAAPFIAQSPVLKDVDLLDLARTSSAARQQAVASRKILNTDVSGTLAEVGNEAVIATLAKNTGAEMAEYAIHRIMDRFPDVQEISDVLCNRGPVPRSVAERLIFKVSDALKEELLRHNHLPQELVEKAVKETHEKMSLEVMPRAVPTSHIERLVKHLHARNRLDENVIARAACTGDIRFLEQALALRTHISVNNIQKILQEGGHVGLQKLCEKAKIQTNYIQILMQALETYHEALGLGSADPGSYKFSRLMLERMLTKMQDSCDHTLTGFMESLEDGLTSKGSSLISNPI